MSIQMLNKLTKMIEKNNAEIEKINTMITQEKERFDTRIKSLNDAANEFKKQNLQMKNEMSKLIKDL